MKTLKVNIIEDDPEDTLIIREMLAECLDMRFQIKTSETVRKGVDLLNEESPDLILLDLSLPDAVGFEGLRKVRTAAPWSDLIILTGNNDNNMGVEALKQGASDYLVKGRIDSNLLVRTILFSQERRKLEEQLRQSQKVEAIGKLAGGIAHDFNNQLGIMNLLIAELMDVNENQSLKMPLVNLNAVVEKCGRLVKQILAFSRQQVLIAEPVDVNQVLLELLPLMQRMVGSQIYIDFIPMQKAGMIKVDRNQFEQALWNLMINAKDAIGKQGKITVMTDTEKIINSEKVIIEISDSGPGIPRDILPKIFDPFFTTKSLGQGTGLGLATVFGIIDQSDAQISVKSEEGKGATFRMAFPLCKEIPIAKNSLPVQSALTPKTVLVCDDEEMLLNLITSVLESAKMTVFRASSAAKALEIFEENPAIDLLITDLTMPVMDGRALAQEIEKINPKTKIIYISGYAEGVEATTDLVKNSKFISKPFNRQVLLAAIGELFHS